jgi:hypothetical protein
VKPPFWYVAAIKETLLIWRERERGLSSFHCSVFNGADWVAGCRNRRCVHITFVTLKCLSWKRLYRKVHKFCHAI